MPLHPDAIPTSEQVRETLLDRIYYPYKKQIWAAFAVIAVVIVAILAAREVRQRRLDDQWTRLQLAQETGRTNPYSDPPEKIREGADQRIAQLKRIVADYPDDPVTPYALADIVRAHAEAGRYDEALATLEELQSKFKDSPLNTEPDRSGGSPRVLAERVAALLRDEREWRAKTTYVHPAPSTTSTALVETTAGSFWMGFYEEYAPEHVANFKRLAKVGYFNGTQVYQVRTGPGSTPDTSVPLLFEAGSAASRYEGPGATPDPGLHDQDEPAATIEPEDARFRVRHLRGVVSSVVMPSGESAHRFMVVAAEKGYPRYDGQNTPFGAILDREGSRQVVDRICRQPTYGTTDAFRGSPDVFRMRDHPYPPIWIRRVTIWQDEKLDAGHAWDTSRSASAQPEPWEATLPAPVQPGEPKKEEAPTPRDPEPPAPKDDESGR